MSFLSQLGDAFPINSWQDVTVLVAVSGGADSVALLRGLAGLKGNSGEGRLIVAHFNHRLRGAESDSDEEFVRELALAMKTPCEVGRSDAPTISSGDGIEAAARAARYDFLTTAAQRLGARYVVTAHTADDQVETLLHRIFRGTGIGGLAGIPKARELAAGISLLRPLLSTTRAEVVTYLHSIRQSFRDDTSNLSRAFTRNRLRHELLPLLERDFSPNIRGALLRLSQLAQANQDLLATLIQPLLSQVERQGDTVILDCLSLGPQHRHLLREFLLCLWSDQQWPQQDMTLEKWDQLAAYIQQPEQGKAAQILPGGIRVERLGDKLRLTPPPR